MHQSTPHTKLYDIQCVIICAVYNFVEPSGILFIISFSEICHFIRGQFRHIWSNGNIEYFPIGITYSISLIPYKLYRRTAILNRKEERHFDKTLIFNLNQIFWNWVYSFRHFREKTLKYRKSLRSHLWDAIQIFGFWKKYSSINESYKR